jgi:xylose isomerase
MIKNIDLNGSIDTNPYKFRHYNINEFSLWVKGGACRARAYL